jgi:hypothetical protein
MSECLRRQQVWVAAVVDPAQVQGVPCRRQVHDGQVDDDVRKALPRLRVALDDMLQPLDQRSSAELNVTFDDRLPTGVHGERPEEQQGRSQETLRTVRPSVEPERLEQQAVPRSGSR